MASTQLCRHYASAIFRLQKHEGVPYVAWRVGRHHVTNRAKGKRAQDLLACEEKILRLYGIIRKKHEQKTNPSK